MEFLKLANKVAAESIWYGVSLESTTLGKLAPPRCFNFLKTGHTATSCPKKPLFPYFCEEHKAHTCSKKNMVTPKCTLCAGVAKAVDPSYFTKQVFSANPVKLLHSPFDPRFPIRVKSSELHLEVMFSQIQRDGAPQESSPIVLDA